MMSTEPKYRYYLLGDYMPIRATVDPEYNINVDAEYPNRETGKLEQDREFLIRIRESDEIEEITAEDFIQHCQRMYAEKTINPGLNSGPG
ncbi:hypothetical protein SAMN05216325_11630 [Nitrosomonas marina]|uniref:Uncharacterized protein n=2 Tax=Nitrosomonas marina TaxID=917 RepID=A0A1H8G525_9PROT|nr:hypothetical protein SAMN05216325_11630 [Nitrosomonas marina]